MRRLIILAAAAAGLGMAGNASAQSIELYVGPPAAYGPSYYSEDDDGSLTRRGYRSGRRVYGYVATPGEAELERPSGPGGCGTYRYWNGDKCVDARNR
jgi:hypothetical protein